MIKLPSRIAGLEGKTERKDGCIVVEAEGAQRRLAPSANPVLTLTPCLLHNACLNLTDSPDGTPPRLHDAQRRASSWPTPMESATNDIHDKKPSPSSPSLHLLVNSDSTTTSVPLHDCIEHSQDYANGMWHPSHAARSASLVTTSTTLWRAQANGYSSHTRSSSIHVSQTSLHADDDSAKLPVLRWFRATHADHSPSSTHSHSPSVSRTPSPTSPSFALREALNDTIAGNSHDAIQRPQPARLPTAFSTRSSIRRSPPFLENLARSTLPTASLTRPLPTSPHPLGDSQNDVDSTAIVITQSPPTRTSIDSLRTLRDRGMGITPDAARTITTSATTSWWWYMREHKSSVDDLLDESDQAGTVEDEAAKIRRKCAFPEVLSA